LTFVAPLEDATCPPDCRQMVDGVESEVSFETASRLIARRKPLT